MNDPIQVRYTQSVNKLLRFSYNYESRSSSQFLSNCSKKNITAKQCRTVSHFTLIKKRLYETLKIKSEWSKRELINDQIKR